MGIHEAQAQKKLALAEKKIAELQSDLQAERDLSAGMRKLLEAAAHDAASLESRLTLMASKLG